MAYTPTYSPTLRQVKGSELTWIEHDDNWNNLSAELAFIALEFSSSASIVSAIDTRVSALEATQIPSGTINDQHLVWDGVSNSWKPKVVSSSVPNGTADQQQLVWDSTTSQWLAQTVSSSLPTGTQDTDALLWNTASSSWVATNNIDLGTF